MDDLWDVTRLAKFLSIKKSTIYGMVERREIPYYRVGRLARFQPAEILDWLGKQRHDPADINSNVGKHKPIKKSDYNFSTEAKILVKRAIDAVKK